MGDLYGAGLRRRIRPTTSMQQADVVAGSIGGAPGTTLVNPIPGMTKPQVQALRSRMPPAPKTSKPPKRASIVGVRG